MEINKAYFEDALDANNPESLAKALAHNESWKDEPLTNGFPPVIMAAYYNRVAVLEVLHAHGANLDVADRQGNSALMGAVFKGHGDTVTWLIKQGANVNHQNPQGASALSFAYDYGHQGIFEELLQAGADATLTNPAGNSIAKHVRAQGPAWADTLLEKYGAYS